MCNQCGFNTCSCNKEIFEIPTVIILQKGDKGDTGNSSIVNNSSVASISKSILNSTYPNATIGFNVDYPFLTGGGKSARKIDNSPSGNWVLTILTIAT